MFYVIMFYLVPANWLLSLECIANVNVYCVMNIVSELLNPFKFHPYVYILKVCIDIPKEVIKVMIVSK